MPGTNEIILSLAEHRGWEGSMTVFGHLGEESLRVVEAIDRLPMHNYVHPTYGTVMSMLNTPLSLTMAPSNAVEVSPTPKVLAVAPPGPMPPGPMPPVASTVSQRPVFRSQPKMDEAQLPRMDEAQLAAPQQDKWQTFYDEGVPYYFNTRTNQVQWQKPWKLML